MHRSPDDQWWAAAQMITVPGRVSMSLDAGYKILDTTCVGVLRPFRKQYMFEGGSGSLVALLAHT